MGPVKCPVCHGIMTLGWRTGPMGGDIMADYVCVACECPRLVLKTGAFIDPVVKVPDDPNVN